RPRGAGPSPPASATRCTGTQPEACAAQGPPRTRLLRNGPEPDAANASTSWRDTSGCGQEKTGRLKGPAGSKFTICARQGPVSISVRRGRYSGRSRGGAGCGEGGADGLRGVGLGVGLAEAEEAEGVGEDVDIAHG